MIGLLDISWQKLKNNSASCLVKLVKFSRTYSKSDLPGYNNVIVKMVEREIRERKHSQVYKVIFTLACGIDAIIIYDEQRLTKIYKYLHLNGLSFDTHIAHMCLYRGEKNQLNTKLKK